MRYIRAALARIAGIFGKDTADDDLREEMQAHLDMEIAENVRRGMSPGEARRQALLTSPTQNTSESTPRMPGTPIRTTSLPASSIAPVPRRRRAMITGRTPRLESSG